MTIDDLGLTVRANNALRNAGIHTAEELLKYGEANLLCLVPGFGRASLKIVILALAKQGLELPQSSWPYRWPPNYRPGRTV